MNNDAAAYCLAAFIYAQPRPRPAHREARWVSIAIIAADLTLEDLGSVRLRNVRVIPRDIFVRTARDRRFSHSVAGAVLATALQGVYRHANNY